MTPPPVRASPLAAWGVVIALATAGLAAVLLAGASWFRAIGEWDDADARPRIVASTTIIGQLAEEIAAGRFRVHTLLDPGQDPHTYEPVPRDALAFERSDLVLLNGFDLDYWAERLARGTRRGTRFVRVAESVASPPLPWPGDDTAFDPHLWMDPTLTAEFVEVIRDALIDLDPEGEPDFRRTSDDLLTRLAALDTWIAEEVERIPQDRRLLVTTHDAYRYFGRRYGIRILDTVWGISTEEEPSAAEIARLFRNLRDHGVPAFVETTINPQLMMEIAGQAGVRLGGELYADALGEPGSGAETYVGMMEHNVRTIVGALSGSTVLRDPAAGGQAADATGSSGGTAP